MKRIENHNIEITKKFISRFDHIMETVMGVFAIGIVVSAIAMNLGF